MKRINTEGGPGVRTQAEMLWRVFRMTVWFVSTNFRSWG